MRNFYIALSALVASVVISLGAQLPLPAVNGPYLGDQLNNLYAITQAYITGSGFGAHTKISASQTSGQANCTQLDANAQQEITTSAGTGYICLPTAIAGKELNIGNGTTQTIDIYSSAVSAVAGTADTINGTAGTTAYTGLTGNKNTTCFAPSNGAWYCGSGS
jgi:hypothetical protein